MNVFTKALTSLFAVVALAACAQDAATPKVNPEAIPQPTDHTEKPTDLAIFNPKVDIIFVIDSSGSMLSVQTNLSRNVNLFAKEMTKMSVLDFRIGVTTTDMQYCNRPDACGRLSGNPVYVDKNTTNLEAELARRMIVGTDGSAEEMMFAPVQAALSSPMDTSFNNGFYRPDAYLAVIFITDADDQSRNMDAAALHRFLSQKKGDPNKVLGYGVIRTLRTAATCTASESIYGKLETFLSMVVNTDRNQKNILSLCDTDYGVRLTEIAKDIVARSAGKVALSRIPNPATIRVFYGTQEIPNDWKTGWVYENSTNSIILSEGIKWDETQGQNGGLRIDFEVLEP